MDDIRGIDDLKPLPGGSPNIGSLRGNYQLEQAIREDGIGRGVVVDRHGHVLVGDKVVDMCRELSLHRLRVVHTTGKTLVVCKRVDVDATSDQGQRMAYADNRISEVSIKWDTKVLIEDGRAGVSLEFTESELVTKIETHLRNSTQGERRKRVRLHIPPEVFTKYQALMAGKGTKEERFAALLERSIRLAQSAGQSDRESA